MGSPTVVLVAVSITDTVPKTPGSMSGRVGDVQTAAVRADRHPARQNAYRDGIPDSRVGGRVDHRYGAVVGVCDIDPAAVRADRQADEPDEGTSMSPTGVLVVVSITRTPW